MEQFKRPGSAELQKPKVQKLDAYGRAKGIGRRKESSARVYLVEGTGEVLINGKSIVQAFPRLHDRESALWALKATQRMDKYNVWALVEGGGVTGQAESITLALARALLVHEPALKPALRRGELENCFLVSIANEACSRNGHIRCKTRREKEAWPSKGEKEASLGQTLISLLYDPREVYPFLHSARLLDMYSSSSFATLVQSAISQPKSIYHRAKISKLYSTFGRFKCFPLVCVLLTVCLVAYINLGQLHASVPLRP
jgi:ribosomal protein S9